MTRVRFNSRQLKPGKCSAVHDGVLFDETYNLLNAWLSVIPGNGAHNLRRLALLETNAADLSFVFTLDQGERVSPHLQREALAVFETPHRTPYAFNLHVQDVGHTLVLGATGSGKSFLLNFLVTHAQKYEPLTVILDLGHSYRKLATLLGGSLPRTRLAAPRTSRSTRSRWSPHLSTCISCTRSCACCSRAMTVID